jgi:hypothetical protein
LQFIRGIKKDMDISDKYDNGPKVTSTEDVARNGNTSSSIQSNKESPSDNNEEEPPPKQGARHRRKGISCRAPFF